MTLCIKSACDGFNLNPHTNILLELRPVHLCAL